jgi:hypothetical protein
MISSPPRTRAECEASALLQTLGALVAYRRFLTARSVAALVGRHPVMVRRELRMLRSWGLAGLEDGWIVATAAGVQAVRLGGLPAGRLDTLEDTPAAFGGAE